jgi:hypothetical protein
MHMLGMRERKWPRRRWVLGWEPASLRLRRHRAEAGEPGPDVTGASGMPMWMPNGDRPPKEGKVPFRPAEAGACADCYSQERPPAFGDQRTKEGPKPFCAAAFTIPALTRGLLPTCKCPTRSTPTGTTGRSLPRL